METQLDPPAAEETLIDGLKSEAGNAQITISSPTSSSSPDTPNQPSSEQPFLTFTDVPTPELQTFISAGLPKSQSSSQVTHPIPQPPTIFDLLKQALVKLLLEVLHFLHAFIFIFVVFIALLGIFGLVFDWPNELLREIWEMTSVRGAWDVVCGVRMRFLDVWLMAEGF